ncbi:hypothetical protein [Sandaracinus amylolyticus]|uniref:Uncharacterized protein n=1 Tax=Sandaracinus amylolyticus TaxID=927083 RepID=A0A0F6W559_9BACT|nr:hypothetical protein [Sandaracinus amylolyticus]AKF07692.1 hypothetical protein DB32_004841 [Sandaracinus amylolyticus]
MDWQTALVLLIELAAIAFLVQRLVLGRRAAPPAAKPDVAAGSLVRKPKR